MAKLYVQQTLNKYCRKVQQKDRVLHVCKFCMFAKRAWIIKRQTYQFLCDAGFFTPKFTKKIGEILYCARFWGWRCSQKYHNIGSIMPDAKGQNRQEYWNKSFQRYLYSKYLNLFIFSKWGFVIQFLTINLSKKDPLQFFLIRTFLTILILLGWSWCFGNILIV